MMYLVESTSKSRMAHGEWQIGAHASSLSLSLIVVRSFDPRFALMAAIRQRSHVINDDRNLIFEGRNKNALMTHELKMIANQLT